MKKRYSSTAQQRQSLLAYLQTHQTITTLEARARLDIMHPGGRVLELRATGNNIQTHWTIQETDLGRHRVAQYVLLNGGDHE